MLFNSLPFIFCFLPVTLTAFYVLGRYDRRAAAGFLGLASIFFYGWWDSRYVLLLVGSILGNFLLADAIQRNLERPRVARGLLVAAVAADLCLLGYYKYANFFVANLDLFTGGRLNIPAIMLPLGISFFTFTQIAFLVDTRRGAVRERNFIHYFLFITYFPHLIAGPILHHAEMMPQFGKAGTFRFEPSRLAIGISLFILGLIKKTVCADGIAPLAQKVFAAAAAGQPQNFAQSWFGALGYAMQIYFDFSAYSDMALGISFMFGIRLPLNFDSPYKAASITDFWRRWHMTLSRFLRDYLYIPLGGNRFGTSRRYANLMITMLLGGLWHGAAWTYIAWGGLHGAFLAVNHGWHRIKPRISLPGSRVLSVLVTFGCVVVAWVFFRASSLGAAVVLLKGMAGLNGFVATDASPATKLQLMGLASLLALSWTAPNAYQILDRFSPALQEPRSSGTWLTWRPSLVWAASLAVLAALSLAQMLSGAPSEFIYFQF